MIKTVSESSEMGQGFSRGIKSAWASVSIRRHPKRSFTLVSSLWSPGAHTPLGYVTPSLSATLNYVHGYLWRAVSYVGEPLGLFVCLFVLISTQPTPPSNPLYSCPASLSMLLWTRVQSVTKFLTKKTPYRQTRLHYVRMEGKAPFAMFLCNTEEL